MTWLMITPQKSHRKQNADAISIMSKTSQKKRKEKILFMVDLERPKGTLSHPDVFCGLTNKLVNCDHQHRHHLQHSTRRRMQKDENVSPRAAWLALLQRLMFLRESQDNYTISRLQQQFDLRFNDLALHQSTLLFRKNVRREVENTFNTLLCDATDDRHVDNYMCIESSVSWIPMTQIRWFAVSLESRKWQSFNDQLQVLTESMYNPTRLFVLLTFTLWTQREYPANARTKLIRLCMQW